MNCKICFDHEAFFIEGGLGAESLVRSFFGTVNVDHPSFSPFSLPFPSLPLTSLSSSLPSSLPRSLLSFLPVLWIRKISLKAEDYCSMRCCECFMNCPTLVPESPSSVASLPLWFTAPSAPCSLLSCVSAEVRSVQSPQLLLLFRNPISPSLSWTLSLFWCIS